MTHPKQYNAWTVAILSSLLPPGWAVFAGHMMTIVVDGKPAVVRVKRAESVANQVQVWRGEPIVVHVPEPTSGADPASAANDKWIVLPVSWQIQFAHTNPMRRQHSSNAFDCMQVPVADILGMAVQPSGLVAACEAAAREARSPMVQFVTVGLQKIQLAVAGALAETYKQLVDTVSNDGDEE